VGPKAGLDDMEEWKFLNVPGKHRFLLMLRNPVSASQKTPVYVEAF
jgi:hypothetical protein